MAIRTLAKACEAAAVREAMEETGLDVTWRRSSMCTQTRRDPSKHTISTVFTARASGEPIGMDDAEEARIFSLDALPTPWRSTTQRFYATTLASSRPASAPRR